MEQGLALTFLLLFSYWVLNVNVSLPNWVHMSLCNCYKAKQQKPTQALTEAKESWQQVTSRWSYLKEGRKTRQKPTQLHKMTVLFCHATNTTTLASSLTQNWKSLERASEWLLLGPVPRSCLYHGRERDLASMEEVGIRTAIPARWPNNRTKVCSQKETGPPNA